MSYGQPTDLSPRRRPGTSLDILPLGYGTSPLGNLSRPTPDETAWDAIDAAWDAGIRHYDAIASTSISHRVATIAGIRPPRLAPRSF